MSDSSALIALSRVLLEVPRDQYIPVVADHLQILLGSDDVFWMQTNWPTNTFAVWRKTRGGRDFAYEQALPAMDPYPAPQTQIRSSRDLTRHRSTELPQCQGDAQEAILELARNSVGQQQLSMILDVTHPDNGRGWVAIRDHRDFDDDALDAASAVLPLLFVFDRLYRPDISYIGQAGSTDRPRNWAELTIRERQIAELLRSGMTARAMGHALGISDRTVGKHLQNVYRKLGRHDRLLVAVDAPTGP